MKKELAIALPLALGAPMVANAACSTTNTGNGSTTKECTTSDLDNLRSNVDIQASAGVALKAEDGTTGNVGADQIAVSSCHSGGDAYFYGDTGGGSVQKNQQDDLSCDSAPDYSTASSS